MRKSYDVVIVGGGVQGLAVAYNLALKGMRSIAVVEKSYLGSGASGRNGEMVRSAFGSEEYIRLYHTSLQLWERLSAELDFNVMFSRSGYLVLATTSAELESYRPHVDTQQRFGLNSRILDTHEVRRLIPALNRELAAGGIFQPEAGSARHDAVVWAYARAARRLGADIFPFTEVTDVVVRSGEIDGVKTSNGDIRTRTVVNAAGAFSGKLSAMVNVELPLNIYRLEMMVTEPLKPFLPVALSSPRLMSYMHQTARGEFAGGAEVEGRLPYSGLKSTGIAIQTMARKFTSLFTGLSEARLMRQWAGVVAKTLDRGPLLGRVEKVKGFILNAAWGGMGFMGAPAGGKAIAELIISSDVPLEIKPFSLERYKTGKLVVEPTLVGLNPLEKH
ncbi:MAG: sarcosine oxidase subunit beta [Acidobacteria bacterium]|nr:sarcosine oxidase subunit beta [Acidobacteriota bacterium]